MKPIFIYIKSLLDFLILQILRLLPTKSSNSNNSLLFINTGQIGDLIVSTPIFEYDYLFSSFEKVYFLMQENYFEMFTDYEGNIDLLGINVNKYKYNFFYRIKKNIELFKLRFNSVYNLTSVRATWNDTLALGIGAREKYAYSNRWKSLLKVMRDYTESRYDKLFADHLYNEYDKMDYLIELFKRDYNFASSEKRSVFRSILTQKKFDIIIAPFSSDGLRDLEIGKLDKIVNTFKNHQILILCSIQQLNKLDKINRLDNISINAGRTKLNELYSLINSSKLFVGLDSGLTHIATKTNTKVIAIIGGGNYGRFLPKPNDKTSKYLASEMDCFGCEWNCIKEKTYCIENVEISTIISNINLMLYHN